MVFRLMNSRCCLKVTSSVQNISALLDVGLEVMEDTDGSVIYLPTYDLKSFFPFTRFSPPALRKIQSSV